MPKQDHLEIIGPDGKITFYFLDPAKGITNIGTHPENDLVLDSPHMAPFQAVLDHQRRPFRLMVLDARANTRVQGKPVAPNVFQEVHDWETIELDGYSLTLLQDLDSQPVEAAHVLSSIPKPIRAKDETKPAGGNGKTAWQTTPTPIPAVPAIPPETPPPTSPVTADAAPPLSPPQARVSYYSSRPVDVRDDIIVAELSGREWTIDVEQTATCDLVITNGGSIVASFDVTVEGLDQSWLTIYPPRVNLNEAGRASVTISMTPPRQPTSSAGPHHFSIAITSPNYPGHVTRLGATLVINPYYEFATGNLTPSRQTTGWRKRSAETHFSIHNQGNSTCSYLIHAQDDENGCRFEFQISDQAKLLKQAEVKVGAGQAVDIPITVSPIKRHLVRVRSRQYHYTVITQPMDEPTTARTMSGSVVSRPLFGLFSILLAAILLGITAILLLRPKVSGFKPANSVIELGTSTTLQWQASLPTTNLQITGVEEPISRGQKMVEVTPTSTGEKFFTLSGGNFLTDLLPFIPKSEQSAKILVVPPYPKITSFSVDKNDILQDDNITVKWSVESADEVVLTVEGVPYSLKPDEFNGEKTLPVHDDTLVVLEAKNYSGAAVRSSYVEVNPPTIEILKFEVTPSIVSLGEEITVEWEVNGIGIDEITITPYPGKIEVDPNTTLQAGKRTFKPKENLEFVLTVKSRNEVKTEIRPVIVGPAKVAPTIDYFKASPNKLAANDDKTVTFAWSVSGDVTSIKISSPSGFTSNELLQNDTGEAVQQGSLNTTVSKTSVFILTAANGNMVSTATVDIEVGEPKRPVEIQIVDVFPAMTIAQGIDVTVYYTVKPIVNGVPINDPASAGLPEVSGEVVVTDGQEQCAGELPILNCTFTPKMSGDHHITATYLGDDVYERRTTTYSRTLKVIGEDLTLVSPGITVNGSLTTTIGITSTIAFTLTPSSGTTPYPPSGTFFMLLGDEQICSSMQVMPVTGKNIAVGKCSTIFDTTGEKQVTVFYRQDKIYNALDFSGKFNVIPASTEVIILSPENGSFHINETFDIKFQVRNSGNPNSTPVSGTVTLLAPENPSGVSCGTIGNNGKGNCTFAFTYSGTDTGSGTRSLRLEYSGDGKYFYGSQSAFYSYTILNDQPVAVSDSYTTDEDSILVINPPGVLSNDKDPEGMPLSVVESTDPFPLLGKLTGPSAEGMFTFDPDGDFEDLAAGEKRTTEFTYTISDGERKSDPSRVLLTITGLNDPPHSPALQAPENGSARHPRDITLKWSATDPDTSDVLSFEVYFGTGSNPPLATTTSARSFSPPTLAPDTEYTWYIISKDAFTQTKSQPWTFRTAPMPGDFDKLSPSNGSVDEIFPLVLSWEESIDSDTMQADGYEICIDQVDNDVCDDVWKPVGKSTSININRPTFSYANTYYWQVRAINPSGTTSADNGEWHTFSTLDYPGPFEAVYPMPGQINIPQPVTLDWTDSSKAEGYEVCYGTTPALEFCETIGKTSAYTITAPLTPDTVYYWQVWAINSATETDSDRTQMTPSGGYPIPFFRTATPPGPFGKIEPPGLQPIPSTLSWNPSSNASDYEVCVNTTDTCAGWIPVGNVLSTTVITYHTGITTTPVLTIHPDSMYFWQVRANNSFGSIYADGDANSGDWGTFTTMPLPGDFNKIGPQDNSKGLTIPLTLRWSTPVTLTERFEYCVNTTETCTEWLPVLTPGEVTITDLTGGAVYYWQVRAVNGAGSNEADGGNWWKFGTHPKPDPFEKTDPISGTVDVLGSITLEWNDSFGTDYYEYCYDTTPDNDCTDWETTVLTSTNISGLAADTTYYWQVRAHNVFGDTPADDGVWWNFKTLPPPGSFNKTGPNPDVRQPIPVTITWTASAKSSSYEICVSSSDTCPIWSPVGVITSTQVATYYDAISGLYEPLSPDSTYFWQVRAINYFGAAYADGNESTGAWHSFTTMPLPDNFNKIAPVDGATELTLPLTLEWQGAVGADSYQYCYRPNWYPSKCDLDSNWVDVGGITSTIITTGLHAGTEYHWQVRAVNGAGYKEAADGWRSFTTMPAPDEFTKLEPADGAVNQVIPLTLRWSPSGWADSYEYCYYSQTEGPAKCANGANWISTGAVVTATLNTELAAGMKYTWQVRAVNSLGKTEADTGWFTFTTLPAPASFNKSKPANNAGNQDLTVELSWETSANAISYLYCYDTTNDNKCGLTGGWVDNGNSTTATISGLEPDTEYFWQVRAANPFTEVDSDNGTWFKFKTRRIPEHFSKISPKDNVSGVNKPLTLEWEASSGAEYYEYCIETDPDSRCDQGSWVKVDNTGTVTITVQITDIVADEDYRWQVRAVNSVGKREANDGTWWDFKTSPLPGAFSKTSPTNSTEPLIDSTTITLTWQSSAFALEYEYCYYRTTNTCEVDPGYWIATEDTKAVIALPNGNETTYWQVRAINSFGKTEANNGEYWAFKTIPPPAGFSLSSPADGVINQKLPLTLEWETSEWASSYLVSIHTTNTFTIWDSPTGITSTVITELEPDTTYYWQVKSSNSFGEIFAEGNGWSFTTQPLPGSFEKTGPANGSTGQQKPVVISWNTSDVNAEHYEYCYDAVINQACNGDWKKADGTTTATLENLQPGTDYEWQVRAVNSLGETYADADELNKGWWTFATVALPSTFTKVKPSSGAMDLELPLKLEWNPSSNAESYEYCLDTEITHTHCTNSENWSSVFSTTVTLDTTTLAYGTTYYWQVRAVNTFGKTPADYDTWWSFTTLRLPAALEKTSPGDGTDNLTIPVSISWNHIGSGGPVDYYKYCVSETIDTCSTWLTTTNTTVSLNDLVYNATYYWQVAAINKAGIVYADGDETSGTWFSFKTQEPPGSFNKISPTNGQTNQPINVSLTWGTSAWADGYEFCIDTSNDNSCENDNWVSRSSNQTSSGSLSGLAYSTTYYWQVRAKNTVGTIYADGINNWFSFTTVPPPPGPFSKLAPTNGANVGRDTDVLLSWKPSEHAARYEYCVNTAQSCTGSGTSIGSWKSIDASITEVTIKDADIANNTRYYWQVRAVNEIGVVVYANDGSWWSFVTRNN